MEFQEYYLKKAAVIFTDLLAVVLVICGVWGGTGFSAGTVFFHVSKAVFCTMIAARILWTNHGGTLCEQGVNFLLWQRRFLKKAPPPLSQAQSLMLRGDWARAEELLSKWHGEYPESASIALFFFGLLADHFRRYDEAEKIACETLKCKFRSREEEAVPLLERTADLLCSAGYCQKALDLLAAEAKKSALYAPEQLRNIRQRELAIKKEIE